MNKFKITLNGQVFAVETGTVLPHDREFVVTVNGRGHRVTLPEGEALDWLMVDGQPYEIAFDRDLRWLRALGRTSTLEIRDEQAADGQPRSGDGRVKAPIPGLISRVLVQPGQAVEVGQPLLVLEAMKMENEIRAPRGGTISTVQVEPGQVVARSHVLLEIEG